MTWLCVAIYFEMGFMTFYPHKYIGPFIHRQLKRELPPPTNDRVIPRKHYRRMPQIPLPRVDVPNRTLGEVLIKRKSYRAFTMHDRVPIADLSSILQFSFGVRTDGHGTHHPSAGAKYGLECYVFVRSVSGLDTGLYHYFPEDHTLSFLQPETSFRYPLEDICTYEFAHAAPVILCVTGVWERIYDSYGDFGYTGITLEAGHVVQNALLLAAHQDVQACPMIGFRFDPLCEVLDINGLIEAPLYMVALGKKVREDLSQTEL